MAKKTENTAARAAYKLAVLEALQEILDVPSDGDAAVDFWREEARKPLERQIAKLAHVTVPEVKRARALDGCAAIAAERDALAARVRVLEGQLANDKRAAGSREGWERCAVLEAELERWRASYVDVAEENAAFKGALDETARSGQYLEFAEPFFSEGN